eukprot:CAMPEP_0172890286 /NCGR_PEP_ID=MMETSP1075-20121228/140833_1 /TAXON_ID=2916 /ORGANISM="Ceratium fusus, Strain PA161109" /LENGTH=56 /DNA_ID=CAMNT_0013744511 /DNA_START=24 /DNA_END=195 /DNA_ORIENTATION=+
MTGRCAAGMDAKTFLPLGKAMGAAGWLAALAGSLHGTARAVLPVDKLGIEHHKLRI